MFIQPIQKTLKTTLVVAGLALYAVPGATQPILPQGPAPINAERDLVFDAAIAEVPQFHAVGAMDVLAADPDFADVLYAGSVNGGLWVTYSATSPFPAWYPLTDDEASQSFSALELDPTDPTAQTLVAGTGGVSSIASSGAFIGILRSTDGGFSWQNSGAMSQRQISGIAARGQTIVASVNFGVPFSFPNVGLFRSTDGGQTFAQISVGNGSTTGLPGGVVHDVAGDPTNLSRLYTGVVFSEFVGASNGIYRSDDTGATWTKVSDPTLDAFIKSSGIDPNDPEFTVNFQLSVGQSGEVNVGIINFDGSGSRLVAVFRSTDAGATWSPIDLPQTVEDGGFAFGIHPGGQGSIHFSIVADPVDSNIVYLGGDRQPSFTEGTNDPDIPLLPNSLGANGFTGRIFRCDASQASGHQCTPLTHTGTANSTAPHADSREMVFDALGRLIQADDGGVYVHHAPRTLTGDWTSLNGNLNTTEIHAVTFDTHTDTFFGGTQDNGSPYQLTPFGSEWGLYQAGDGANVAVDLISQPGFSVRLGSFQFLGGFNTSTWDANNNLVDFRFLGLQVLDGGARIRPNFYTPIELNTLNPQRLVLGALNSVYESLDQGDTIREIGPGIRSNEGGAKPIAYGAWGQPDLLYVGSGDILYVRKTAADTLAPSTTFPGTGTGANIQAVAVDPRQGDTVFVVTDDAVYTTSDGGTTWLNITGSLASQTTLPFRSAEFVPAATAFDFDRLVLGSTDGIYGADARDGFATWSRVGGDIPGVRFPTVIVQDLVHNPVDGLVTVGTLGRGTWALGILPGLGFLQASPIGR